MPSGARLVGGGTTPVIDDFAAVLAVSDPQTVLEDIARQLDPTGPDTGDATVSIKMVDHAG